MDRSPLQLSAKKVRPHTTLLVIALFVAMGACAQLPHLHEGDWSHSTHSDCPLYRLASQAAVLSVYFILLASPAFLETSFLSVPSLREEDFFKRFRSRAPPFI